MVPKLDCLKKVLNWFWVTLAVRPDENSKQIRAATLALVSVIAFIAFGSNSILKPLRLLAQAPPFELDWALRTVSLGWFDSHNTVPISMVEIGEATYRAWGSPAITPRADLVRMLDIVTRSNPTAVVVDIDLSFGGGDDLGIVRKFLRTYSRSAPLIFPKRIEPGAGDTRRLAVSPLDEIVAGNSRLSWAHASFETDKGGAVRQWADWLEVCTDNATLLLPSITVRLAAVLPNLPPGLERPKPPPLRSSCQREGDAPGQLLLVGPRLTGPLRHAMMADARWVAASALLDRKLARDDDALFGDRVVFIGAAHSGSGDFWLTPSGVLPGVELIANTVRFAPLRVTTGPHAEMALRAVSLFAFGMFAGLIWCFRPIVAILLSAFGGLVFVAALITWWNYFRVFEAIEASLLLVVQYKTVQVMLDLIADLKTKKGFWRTVLTEHCWGVLDLIAEWWKKKGWLRTVLAEHWPFVLDKKRRPVRRRT